MQKRRSDMILAERVCMRVIALIVIVLTGCTGLKHVPENEKLYTGAEVKLRPLGKVAAKKHIKEMMDQNISPKPNTSIFGMRPGLWFYYIAGETKRTKGFRYFVKSKLGQVPVYLSDVDPERTSNLVEGHLKNNGYFQAEVKYDVREKKKTAKILYTASVSEAYRLRDITYPELDTLFKNIDSVKRDSYLKTAQRYNLERLQAEQQRIEEALENMGFYFFDDKHLIFEADSTVGDREVDLLLQLEPGVPKKATRIYKLGKITVYPNYSLHRDSVRGEKDTLRIDGYQYVDRLEMYKPKIITKVINMKPGKIYSREDQQYTLSHLMSMGAFKFVDIKFTESKRDSSVINSTISLTPYMKKSIRADLQGISKSNNFVGPFMNLKFTNRNTFRGAERLDISATAGYEIQISRKVPDPVTAFELGAETSLSVPRFVTPFDIYYPTRRFLPTTDVKLGFRLQQRINFFRLNAFNLSLGYTWRENTLKIHELLPVDINYVRLGEVSKAFEDVMIKSPYLARSLENQFIMGTRYVYTMNTQINPVRMQKFRERKFERSHFYFTGNAETAGNLVQLFRGGDFLNRNDSANANKIFGSAYAQFLRGEADFRYYWQVSKTTKLATRLLAGAGYAYGNSVTMPYIRQFAIGGANSIRAFPARSLGPGTFNGDSTESNTYFIDQRGDFKLEGNAEFRFDIVRIIKGAVFVDAGNIWLWRKDDQRPGGQFQRDEFLKELAVGTGIGLRGDFNFFVLRFDLGFPLRKPYLPENDRWVIDEIDLGSSSWRRENLILNIAVGYPF